METRIQNDGELMAILREALQHPAEEREAYLRAACNGDQDLYDEVAEAVRWEEQMGNFLLTPLVESAFLVRPFEPGQVVAERFEILSEIGEGGMGMVYEAFDRRLQQRVAIKAAKPGFQRLLSPELKSALKVSHHNICRVHEIHTERTQWGEIDFLTMEFLEGKTLSAYLRDQGKLSHEEALDVMQADYSAAAAEVDVTMLTPELSLAPGGRGEIVVNITSGLASELHGEAQVISPFGTWEAISPSAQGFSVLSGATTAVRFGVSLPETARPGAQWWALVKVMYYGRVRYTPAIGVFVRAE